MPNTIASSMINLLNLKKFKKSLKPAEYSKEDLLQEGTELIHEIRYVPPRDGDIVITEERADDESGGENEYSIYSKAIITFDTLLKLIGLGLSLASGIGGGRSSGTANQTPFLFDDKNNDVLTPEQIQASNLKSNMTIIKPKAEGRVTIKVNFSEDVVDFDHRHVLFDHKKGNLLSIKQVNDQEYILDFKSMDNKETIDTISLRNTIRSVEGDRLVDPSQIKVSFDGKKPKFVELTGFHDAESDIIGFKISFDEVVTGFADQFDSKGNLLTVLKKEDVTKYTPAKGKIESVDGKNYIYTEAFNDDGLIPGKITFMMNFRNVFDLAGNEAFQTYNEVSINYNEKYLGMQSTDTGYIEVQSTIVI